MRRAGGLLPPALLCLCALLAGPAAGRTIEVRPGTPLIQEALDAAAPGDVVLLADGVYSGPGNRDLDFRGKALVLRSRGGPAVCIIDCGGEGRGLRFRSGETPAARVEGITIVNGRVGHRVGKGGDAVARFASISGGAILCEGASPTIAGCILLLNRAAGGGAVACDDGAAPRLIDCLLRQNTAELGGGLHARHSAPRLERCFLLLNTAERGGGVSAWDSPVRLDGCTLDRYSASGGGAVSCEEGSRVELTDCLLHGNQATLGGAVYVDEASPLLDRCTLVGNSGGWGSALSVTGGSPVLRRSVVTLGVRGGTMTGAGSTTLEVTCSVIQGNCGGDWIGSLAGLLGRGGNQDAAPAFVDPAAGDFRLGPGSIVPAAGCGLPGASAPRLKPPAALAMPPALNLR